MHIRRFILVPMGLALLAGCASAPSDGAEPESLGSNAAALSCNGVPLFVSHLESDVAAIAAVVGETGSFRPTSHGIPQRMAAIEARLSAIESDITTLESADTSASATLAQLQSSSAQFIQLRALVSQTTTDASSRLKSLPSDGVSIADMSSMQLLMNHLSQVGEMSTAVVSAINQAIIDMTRGTKGA